MEYSYYIMIRYLIGLLSISFSCFGMSFTFSKGSSGWSGGFADYPIGQEVFYELSWGWDSLPAPILSSEGRELNKGLYLSGNNHSDDLFMFVRKKIVGLLPNRMYELDFQVLIESNIPLQTVGIGGSPGESVYFKAGASAIEPQRKIVGQDYRMNVDKGNQSRYGKNALVIGNLANPAVDPQKPSYQPLLLRSERSLTVRSNRSGEIWIFLGTDSGFEGKTKYYIAEVNVNIRLLEK
jgi:hypothetical protein